MCKNVEDFYIENQKNIAEKKNNYMVRYPMFTDWITQYLIRCPLSPNLKIEGHCHKNWSNHFLETEMFILKFTLTCSVQKS